MSGQQNRGDDGKLEGVSSGRLLIRLCRPLDVEQRRHLERSLAGRWIDPLARAVHARYEMLTRADAEEVAIHAVGELLSSPETYDPSRGKPETLLRVIAFRAAQKRLRRRRRQPERVSLETVPDGEVALEPGGLDPETSADTGPDNHPELTSAFDQLSPRAREVVGLHAHGLTNPEIAEMLGCSQGAVRVALHRGLKRLGTLLR